MSASAGASAASGLIVRPLKNFVRKSALREVRSPIALVNRWRIVKGDTVFVNGGRDAGKSGKVAAVQRSKNRLFVEGLNLVRKKVRPSADGSSPGGIIAVEAPLHYSRVNLIDPSTKKPTKVGVRWTQAGEKVRVARATETIIPFPPERRTERSSVRPSAPGPRDTPAAQVAEVTYFPQRELLPYLAAAAVTTGAAGAAAAAAGSGSPAASIFRRRKGDERAPDVLRLQIKRTMRNRIRARFEAKAHRAAAASSAALLAKEGARGGADSVEAKMQ